MIRQRTVVAFAPALAAWLAAVPAVADAPAQGATAVDPSASDDRLADWSLQLEAGSEYDSNVHRLDRRAGEAVDVDGSPLARLGARHRLSWRRTARERFTLSSHGGLKLFASDSGQTENVAVLSTEGAYDWGMPGRGAIFGLTGSYYDAIPYQLADPHDMFLPQIPRPR